MKEQIKKQLQELDQKQQDFVQRIGEARDLLAELMFTSDAFFTLQKRELIHNLSCGCDHEDQYIKEGVIFCNDCGASLGFVEEDIQELPFNYNLERTKEAIDLDNKEPIKNINYCPHLDCGWCYASKDIETNAINSGCFDPQKCPANQG